MSTVSKGVFSFFYFSKITSFGEEEVMSDSDIRQWIAEGMVCKEARPSRRKKSTEAHSAFVHDVAVLSTE